MTGVALVLVFLAVAFLMYTGKLPALVALPLLALALTFTAGLPHHWPATTGGAWGAGQACWRTLNLAFVTVVGDGVSRLQGAIFTVMLGGIFAHLIKLTHTAESLVRRVAELAGDEPFTISLVLSLAVSFLFTTLGGLGSVIMVANIFFPVLLSLGVPALLAACIFLMAMATGGLFNLVNLAFFADILKLGSQDMLRFVIPFALLNTAALVTFMAVEFKRSRLPLAWSSVLKAGLGLGILLAAAAGLKGAAAAWPAAWVWAGRGFGAAILLVALLPPRLRPGAAVLAPFVPLGLVLFLNWPINAGFVAGILYLLRTASRGHDSPPANRQLTQAVVEGLQGVTPAIGVMMGIGMVLVAVAQPPVAAALEPLLRVVVPSSAVGYLAFFGLLAPLALYRGPLNLWGMGGGLLGLLQRTGLLSPAALFAAFMSTGQLQGVCDPTNTYNVWIAAQLKIDVNAILRKTLPYIWVMASAGLVLGLALG
ncbi:MAG: hypothetical protein WC943_02430 [Elusimicrobiota bacterium]|jgi:hypothetical protein